MFLLCRSSVIIPLVDGDKHFWYFTLVSSFTRFCSSVNVNIYSASQIFTKSERNFCVGSNLARIVSEIRVLLEIWLNTHLRQSIQEWTKWNMWKAAFKKFEVIWSAHSWILCPICWSVKVKKVVEIWRSKTKSFYHLSLTCSQMTSSNALFRS